MGKRVYEGRFHANRAGNHARVPRKRRVWPWVLTFTFLGLCGVGLVGAVFALQAMEVRDDLLAAKSRLSAITELVKAGDGAQMQVVADDVLALTSHADAVVHGPLWDAATAVPVVGENITAVKSATVATHILVRDALPAGVQLLSSVQLDQLKVAGGGVNLDPFRGAVDVLPQISSAFLEADAQVASIDRKKLLPFVDSAIGQLLDVMDDAGPALATAEKYLPTLLALAGSTEPRTYLVLFQNNAEIRATGGNAATGTIIRVHNGGITQIEDAAAERFFEAGIGGEGSLEFSPETQSLYEWDTTMFSQNFTRTPDFATSASMFSAVWTDTTGDQFDGVISLDPVVLSYMLEATGPIPLADGSEINSGNAVKLLLSDTYERFGIDGLAADAYFSDVSGQLFTAISSGNWDPMTMLGQLERSVQEQRLYAWFAREGEQAMASEVGLTGALATDNNAATQVGIYLNDAAYSKLEYYLSTAVDVTCDAAARTVTTALTMTSSVPGSDISSYTLGWRNNRLGLPRTTMILDALYFAPPGGAIVGISPESGDVPAFDRSGTESGREGSSRTIALAMGDTRTISYTSTVPSGPLGPLSIRYTPTVTTTPVTIAPSCSELFPEAAPTTSLLP